MTLECEQIRLLLHFQWLQGIHYDDAAKKLRDLYGVSTSKMTAWRWYETFKTEGVRLKDKKHTGRTREVDREHVIGAIRANPTMTTRMLAEDFGCVHGTTEDILHEAGLKWRKTRWIPHEFTVAQKQTRVKVAKQLLRRQRRSPFLNQLITMDETWIPYRSPNPHNAWLLPKERAPSTPVRDFRQNKITMCVFWDSTGIIHWELVDRTINSELYYRQLKRVAKKLRESRRRKPVIFLHDNARPHTSKMTKAKLAKLGWDVLPHAPYSPDKAPSDFHLFRSLKNWLKGKKFS